MGAKPVEIEMPGPDRQRDRADYMPNPDLPGPEPDPDSNPPSSDEREPVKTEEAL